MNIYMVYKKYNKDFLSYAKSITHSEEKAFDLVQESYVAALEKDEIFYNMNEYQIKSWFFTTIRNKNIDYIRKYNKLAYLQDYDVIDYKENFEESAAIKDLLDKLPDKNREVLLLKYKMNLNSREIGKVLGISPSTVRSRLCASLKLLKKLLKNQF